MGLTMSKWNVVCFVVFVVMLLAMWICSGNADADPVDPAIERMARAQESQADSQRKILDELVKIRRELER